MTQHNLSNWRLQVTPAVALIDVPRVLSITGLKPGQFATLRSETVRAAGVVWRSAAQFQANERGEIDLSSDAPTSGDYDGVSALGLIWSQVPDVAGSREVFPDAISQPLTTWVIAEVDGIEQRVSFEQQLMGEGVERREVREDGLVGTLFTPAGVGPFPAIIVLNGSGGGANEPRAALYASYGFAAFALAYFKAPGLSDYISNTPLEYFKKGLDWVRREVKPAHDFVALNGQSRGGELVLLLASLFPRDVSAVIAYVPGAVVHGGQNAADPAVGRDGAAWLLNGEIIPYVWQNNRHASWALWDDGPSPRRHEKAILTALDDADAVERSRIRVEKIEGPVLSLSGTDDGNWPSTVYGTMVESRLKAFGHPYAHDHLAYEGAGHAIVFPYIPTTQLVYLHPVSKRPSTSGGEPVHNAHANEHSWTSVLQFLRDAVAQHARAHANANVNAETF